MRKLKFVTAPYSNYWYAIFQKTLNLLLCAICFSLNCYSQGENNNVINISDLPSQGLVLNRGWKFHVGDDTSYMRPEYDDSKWQSINPTLNINDIPALWENSIVWFRLHFKVDTSITEQLAMMMQQTGASEMYLNGRLFHRFGVVSSVPDKIVAYDPFGVPLSFQLNKFNENVLAVRYALQPNLFYNRTFIRRQNAALAIRINYAEAANHLYLKEKIRDTTSNTFRIGAFIILFILHLVFYLYYPVQKANFFFALFALFMIIPEVVQVDPNEVRRIYSHFTIMASSFGIALLSLLTALYFLLNQERRWIYWGLIFVVIITIALHAVIPGLKSLILIVLTSIIIQLEILRISFKAIQNKQRGAWIIALGSVCYFLFWGALLYFGATSRSVIHIGTVYRIDDLFYNLAFFSIPIATSVHLALEFAFSNNTLKRKLREVEELSQKNLAHEYEKQQILAHQNETLEKQVVQRTSALNKSMEELKQTQTQLIHKEKMASLGELTTGIAHEIQNPLNFVNNFSEVSNELIDEMQFKIDSGDTLEIKQIATDLKQNLEKINHHGKRADAIVKGMLEHSRQSTGKKEPTQINRLTDDYLRLSYQAMLSKDKSFNAVLETHFDEDIDKINVVPQDIGRVLINLFNNAFYSINEKRKQLDGSFEPRVSVSTKKCNDKVEIHVMDNGNGIPLKIRDKIYQPFFTTKPTGQGTGLGLSLSYEIITKEHGGELTMKTEESKFAEFIVRLPIE